MFSLRTPRTPLPYLLLVPGPGGLVAVFLAPSAAQAGPDVLAAHPPHAAAVPPAGARTRVAGRVLPRADRGAGVGVAPVREPRGGLPVQLGVPQLHGRGVELQRAVPALFRVRGRRD